MRVENSSGSLLTRYRTKFRGFLGEAYRRTSPVISTGVMVMEEIIHQLSKHGVVEVRANGALPSV